MTSTPAGSWDELTWPGTLPLVTATDLQLADAQTKSAPFTVTADEQTPPGKYWVKALEGPEGPYALIAEAIVSRLGTLIHAPVCETAFIDVSAFAGRVIAPGQPGRYQLSHSVAYGSRDLPDPKRTLTFPYPPRGDNLMRLAQDCVLYDWCLGGDDQWLINRTDNRVYSHDHGRWLLTTTGQISGQPTWSATDLDAAIDMRRISPHHKLWISKLDAEYGTRQLIRQAAESVASISHDDLVAVLDPIVTAWSNANIIFRDGLPLEATMRRVGRWLETRRTIVTAHLTD